VTFETDDNYSIRFKMKKHCSHSTNFYCVPLIVKAVELAEIIG